MRIEISNDAKKSLTNIYKYCSNISLNYAVKMNRKIYNAVYDLQFAPYIGRYVPELNGKIYREIICGNYRIIYFISKKYSTIFILYMFCSNQNSKMFFNTHKQDFLKFLFD